MSDMSPRAQVLFKLYDRVEAETGEAGILRARLENEKMGSLQRWALGRRLRKIENRIKFYERAIKISREKEGFYGSEN